MSSTERAALLDAARASGADEVKRWEALYKPTPIVAPIDGTVILKNLEAGQTFANSDAIFVLSNRLTVKAEVDETDIAKIKMGIPAKITLDAYSKVDIDASVGPIAYEATTVNNVTTYVVDIIPSENPEFMRSGMTANVSFEIEKRQAVLVIPTAAIQWNDKGASVIFPDRQSHPVKLGVSDGRITEVLDGVKEGQIVLIQNLKSGSGADDGQSSPFGFSRRKRK
jgi:macrolide-specific efflux system membrane fusion protein